MTSEKFETWKNSVEVLRGTAAEEIRQQFITAFIDTQHPRYTERIATLRDFNDGPYYTGYLWDYTISRQFANVDVALKVLASKSLVYAFWDLHSSERIRIADYWRFGRADVLLLTAEHLAHGLGYLPEDLYVFDSTATWAVAFTHEYSDDVQQCLIA